MKSTVCLAVLTTLATVLAAGEYRSPIAVAASPDGAAFAVGDFTAGRLALVGTDGVLAREVALAGQPAGVAWAADGRLYVAERGAWTVAEVDPAAGAVTRRFDVGRYPVGLAASATHLVVANNGVNTVSIIDRASGAELGRVPCVSRPWGVALAPDGATAVVTNLTPAGDAREPTMGLAVTLVDVLGAKPLAAIDLPPGSINGHGVSVSPDGKWAYVAHSVGRFTLPTTQLERGWVMTHGLSIIDLQARELYATVLLDLMMEGAADPWEVVVAPDGATAWVTLAGVHQVARLDLALLHALLAGKADEATMQRLPRESVWREIAREPLRRAHLVNDLAALYSAGVLSRVTIPAAVPRGAALSTAGDGTLAVASYFGGELLLLDPATLAVRARTALGPQPEASAERLGERLFYDAEQCFQHWLSCASCHPEGRADALNWDLLNDGMGNPKNTKSLVLSHRTPPAMAAGVRPDMEAATGKGFMFIQFRVLTDAQLDAVRAYLKTLPVEGSPYLVKAPGKKLSCKVCHTGGVKGKLTERHMPIDGQLTPEAERGMALFLDEKVACAKCHPGPLFTDLKLYDTGTRHELDRRDTWDTPTCYELWATAPYLHDGSAPTLMDMLGPLNPKDQHGRTSHLSEEEKRALAAYLLSL